MLCGGPAAAGQTRITHHSIVTAEAATNAPGQAPDLNVIGTLLVGEYTLDTDSAYRVFKIPTSFKGSAAFHVHWTKESGVGGNGDESGNVAKWRISYKVFNGGAAPGGGAGEDVNVAATVIEYEDTYLDNGTTTRIVYRTPNLPAAGFVAGYYLGVCIEAITPVGTPMGAEPALASLDLTFSEEINQ
jgi:hypothetical protein